MRNDGLMNYGAAICGSLSQRTEAVIQVLLAGGTPARGH